MKVLEALERSYLHNLGLEFPHSEEQNTSFNTRSCILFKPPQQSANQMNLFHHKVRTNKTKITLKDQLQNVGSSILKDLHT